MCKCLLLLAFALAVAGCGGEQHEMRGLVVKVDPQAATVTISHDPVPGFMDAMVMPFSAGRAEDLAGLRPGQLVSFRLTVGRERSRIDRIQVLSASTGEPSISAPAGIEGVPVGGIVPDFSLVDQSGQAVSLQALRGKVVVVTFIYTRCPLPDFCPRVMTIAGALRDRFRARLGDDLALLTISFDPRHDTPERLREYGERYGANVPGWHLLTGSEEAVARVCALFGVEAWPDEGMITHSLQTAVIDRHGRLAALATGNGFSAKQTGDVVGESLNSER